MNAILQIMLIIGIFIVVRNLARLFSWVRHINDDLYDIKINLRLPVVPRTREKRHQKITTFIDRLVRMGKDEEAIMNDIESNDVCGDFGSKDFLGKLKVSDFEKYITFQVQQFRDGKLSKRFFLDEGAWGFMNAIDERIVNLTKDIYDIKKHLGLNAQIRTKEEQNNRTPSGGEG